MRAVAVLVIAAFMAGCASNGPATSTNVCPPVKPYSGDLENTIAGEIQQMDRLMPGNHIHGLMDDYGRLRAAARACAHP